MPKACFSSSKNPSSGGHADDRERKLHPAYFYPDSIRYTPNTCNQNSELESTTRQGFQALGTAGQTVKRILKTVGLQRQTPSSKSHAYSL
mmetsp:Transcript_49113/g.76590  ORF Transcript_49113/g.76590 Transcript_49113/m.76590 type:complete len:90 (-) Transcript_49113:74-343(-)